MKKKQKNNTIHIKEYVNQRFTFFNQLLLLTARLDR